MSPAGYQSVIVRRGCAETTDAVTASAATSNQTTGRQFMVFTTPPRLNRHAAVRPHPLSPSHRERGKRLGGAAPSPDRLDYFVSARVAPCAQEASGIAAPLASRH